MLSVQTSESIRSEIVEIIHSADLGAGLQKSVLDALGSKTRVLPEGKPNLCSALIIRSHESAGGRDTSEIRPVVAAMEMLLAAYDVVDDLEDDEVPIPEDRRDLGQTLETVCSLLMLCHKAIGRLSDSGMPPGRVLNLYKIIDKLGLDALRGQNMDMAFELQSDVPVEAAINASSLKSASLVRCAAELGAAAATGDEDIIRLHAHFGWHFGLVLQLMNDISAVWPGESQKSDLRLKKKTLPIAFALSLAESNGDRQHSRVVKRYYEGDRSTSEDDVKLALWRCGAIHYTWIVAAKAKASAATISRFLERSGRDTPKLSELLT
jgi:geranylgeranyl pyrophosphate synthase